MSLNESGRYNKNDSERVFFQIIKDMEEKFKWIDLSEVKGNSMCYGLPTVLLDSYVSDQIMKRLLDTGNYAVELRSFFSYVEGLLGGTDSLMKECFQTTLIERIASEQKSILESVLPLCEKLTKQSIINTIASFYGNAKLAEELSKKC